jgi:ABC-2 type transport system permease protein
MSWRRLLAIVVKELRQLRRDRVTLAMIVGIPVMQLVLFGYAINLNLRGLDAGIADQANTSASRALVMDMVATGVIAPTMSARSPQELMEALRRGEIDIGVVVPPDFERRRFDGSEAVQVLVDGSDTVVQSAAVQLAQLPLDTAPTSNAKTDRSRGGGQIAVVSFYNPERRSAVNIVPGLIGVILTMAVLLLGLWLFDVPIRGSALDVYFAAVLLILANLTLGLLISTQAQSQFQAMQMTFFVFLPSILLSGFMFPFAGMPRVIQWFAEVLPLTHFLRIIRGVMLRGANLLELWQEVLALLAFTAVMMTLAILRFRKRLD